MAQNNHAERPERTRSHYIEAISRNHVERFILLRGHAVDEPRPDYGYDIVVTTFDYKGDAEFNSGVVENSYLFIQLKATDSLETLADGQTIRFEVKRRHLTHWVNEPMPVFLIVYSVKDKEAYWLHMQPYLKSAQWVMPPQNQEMVMVHLSKLSIVDEDAVDTFRQRKQAVLRIIEGLKLYE